MLGAGSMMGPRWVAEVGVGSGALWTLHCEPLDIMLSTRLWVARELLGAVVPRLELCCRRSVLGSETNGSSVSMGENNAAAGGRVKGSRSRRSSSDELSSRGA